MTDNFDQQLKSFPGGEEASSSTKIARQLIATIRQRDALLHACTNLELAFMVHTKWSGDPPHEIVQARSAIALTLSPRSLT